MLQSLQQIAMPLYPYHFLMDYHAALFHVQAIISFDFSHTWNDLTFQHPEKIVVWKNLPNWKKKKQLGVPSNHKCQQLPFLSGPLSITKIDKLHSSFRGTNIVSICQYMTNLLPNRNQLIKKIFIFLCLAVFIKTYIRSLVLQLLLFYLTSSISTGIPDMSHILSLNV